MEGITETQIQLLAQSGAVPTIVSNINTYIINPLIGLLFGLALIVFIWGIIEYIWQSDSDAARQKGRSHVLWGIVGMFIMFSVLAIIRIILNTIGADIPSSI